MKTIVKPMILAVLCIQCAFAGGSIGWEDVKSSIAKSDPELVGIIERNFLVNPSGGGVRLGPSFGERQGERIAPYEFGAEDKKTREKCVLVIEESEDHEFTGRFKFVKKAVENGAHEEAGAGKSTARSESDSEHGDKPNTAADVLVPAETSDPAGKTIELDPFASDHDSDKPSDQPSIYKKMDMTDPAQRDMCISLWYMDMAEVVDNLERRSGHKFEKQVGKAYAGPVEILEEQAAFMKSFLDETERMAENRDSGSNKDDK